MVQQKDFLMTKSYVESLEQQNEELQKRLSDTETKIASMKIDQKTWVPAWVPITSKVKDHIFILRNKTHTFARIKKLGNKYMFILENETKEPSNSFSFSTSAIFNTVKEAQEECMKKIMESIRTSTYSL